MGDQVAHMNEREALPDDVRASMYVVDLRQEMSVTVPTVGCEQHVQV